MRFTNGHGTGILLLLFAGWFVPTGSTQDQVEEFHLAFQVAAKKAISQVEDLKEKYRSRLLTLEVSTPERQKLIDAELELPGSQAPGQWTEFTELQAIFHNASKTIQPHAFAARKQLIAKAEAQLDRLLPTEMPERSRRLAEEKRKLARVLTYPELRAFLAERRSRQSGVLRGRGKFRSQPVDVSFVPEAARFVKVDVSLRGNWVAQAADGRVFGSLGNQIDGSPGEYGGLKGCPVVTATSESALGARFPQEVVSKYGRPFQKIQGKGIRDLQYGRSNGCVLSADGQLTAFGSMSSYVGMEKNVAAIGWGEMTAAAVTRDGKVLVWGNEDRVDPMKNQAASIMDAIDIASGDDFHVILRSNGTIASLGNLKLPVYQTRYVRVEAGNGIALGERVNGEWHKLGARAYNLIDWLPVDVIDLDASDYPGGECWIWIEPG